jgi:Tfp pilus assembly pilus retraction ATPase PilT
VANERKNEIALPSLPPQELEQALPTFEDETPLTPVRELYSDLEEILESGETVDEDYTEAWAVEGDDDEEEDPEVLAARRFDIDKVLTQAIDAGASDVHISADDQVAFTILKDIKRAHEFGVMSGKVTEKTMFDIISNVLEDYFIQNLELDTSYVIQSGPHRGRRTRLSIGRSFGKIFMVFRVIADSIPTPTQIGINKALLDWTHYPNGLILICGPTGTGKALRLDTKMPTPEGRTTMGEVTLGSRLLDSGGQVTIVTGLSEINEHPLLYRLKLSNGQKVFADEDHQWIVSVLSASPALRLDKVMTTGEMCEMGIETQGLANFAIPVGRRREDTSVRGGDEERDFTYVVSLERVREDSSDYGPVRCISVDSPDHSYLIEDHIVTHNSTTFASMLHQIQLTYPKKIITVEKPIEYVFGIDGAGFVTQREVGVDAVTFGDALTSAMRQAPDVIMIGEVRNREEVSELLRASESGHLAMSTMHTNSCAATINRIRSLFEGDEQKRILSTLSDNLRGICNQVLVKSPDGQKVSAVREILPMDGELKKYVAEGDVAAIRLYQEKRGIAMEDELVRAYQRGLCTLDEARAQAVNLDYFDYRLDSE